MKGHILITFHGDEDKIVQVGEPGIKCKPLQAYQHTMLPAEKGSHSTRKINHLTTGTWRKDV